MKILHIGDYHFKPKGVNYEQTLMIDKMTDALKSKGKIDLILFSGDLVFSGTKKGNFDDARKILLDRLSNELNIDTKNIILCQGNHDINREENINSVINYFDEKISDNDKLNEEYSKNTQDFKLSLKASNNFVLFLKEFSKEKNDIQHDLFTISKRSIENKLVAIVCLNSSWLSCGLRDDNGKLMLPTRILKDAINEISDADCKILMMHHPLGNFKEFNATELEDLIHKEFNLMFSGHIHREQIGTKYAGNNGIYANTTQATLTFDKDGEIGYSLIEYNLEESDELVIYRATYSSKSHSFADLSPVYVHIPCGEEKAKQNKLRKKITSKYKQELDIANELLLDYDETTSANFIDIFTHPILSTTTETNTTKTEESTNYNYENFYADEKNFLIFGKDKCGKTSLLKRIQLHYLKYFSRFGKIPL